MGAAGWGPSHDQEVFTEESSKATLTLNSGFKSSRAKETLPRLRKGVFNPGRGQGPLH